MKSIISASCLLSLLTLLLTLFQPLEAATLGHPSLILTQQGVADIRANLGRTPLFDTSVQKVKEEVDAEIAVGIKTPIPKDYSGGYTHERHKRNFLIAQKAGVLFQILQDDRYARYVRDMLLQYEAMYKNLPVHPQTRSYARGKLFWQCLNDSNWLVYMSQAYDSIYNFLSAAERQRLEQNLFRPFADFISLENPQFYNRIHNHSTWGNAAVGMIGLVMDDDQLIQRALYGIKDDGLKAGIKDDDGGYIKVAGQKVGFLANLEEPFSPDGYFTEGPYYQRYAMYPFIIFALAMHNSKPEVGVLEHKDGVLMKAVDALLTLTDADGEFFPLNDGQKGMSYYSRELVTAVDVAYLYGNKNPQLLSIAQKQNRVLLDQSGLAVAKGVLSGKAEPFVKKSINLSDGPNGKQGGVGILRYGDEDFTLVYKYAAQGFSHGHYDRLSFSFYQKGDEVLQDYGLSRFVNIEQKGGGNYLKENKTWAKQTIAHNTLSQDETSHFNGKYELGSQHHPELYLFDAGKENLQLVSAKENMAYPGTQLHRTMVMIKDPDLDKPYLLDIMKVSAKAKHQYDLPYYFMGQVLNANFQYKAPAQLQPLGKTNGYQHLYLEAQAKAPAGSTQFSWLQSGIFYTLTSATSPTDKILFTRIGANDPDFNLRRDAGFMIRRANTDNTAFATIIEPHGSYSPVSELSVNSNSKIAKLTLLHDDKNYTAVSIQKTNGKTSLFILANTNSVDSKKHHLRIGAKVHRWQGAYYYAK